MLAGGFIIVGIRLCGESVQIKLGENSADAVRVLNALNNLPVSTYWQDIQDPSYKCTNPGTIIDRMIDDVYYEEARIICEAHQIPARKPPALDVGRIQRIAI